MLFPAQVSHISRQTRSCSFHTYQFNGILSNVIVTLHLTGPIYGASPNTHTFQNGQTMHFTRRCITTNTIARSLRESQNSIGRVSRTQYAECVEFALAFRLFIFLG